MDKRWARIQAGIVFEFTDEDPDGRFHPDLEWVEAPNDVVVGSTYKDGEFTPPPPPPEPEIGDVSDPVESPTSVQVYRTTVSKTEYYGLFTPVEEATIRLTASKTVTAEMVEAADAAERQKLMAVLVLRVMLDRVDKLAATQIIQLGDAQVAQGLALCVQMSLLEDHRPAEITRGVKEN